MREKTRFSLFREAACSTAEKQASRARGPPPGQPDQHQERLPVSGQTAFCIPAGAHPPVGAALAMAFVWLAVFLVAFLVPVSGLLPLDHDSYPIDISDPDPPIKNLRMEPERKRLTWDLHGNVSEITCFINSKAFAKARKSTYCSIPDLSCQATNYSIRVTKGQPFSTWIQYPSQEGNPRAAAENLTCWVHDVDFLTCSWAVGREAPRDVQYSLYLENLDSYEKWPCSQYTADEQGTNVQCRFHNISVLSKDQTRFLVNGTSSGSKIPCSETSDRLAKIEVLAAPNVTSRWCNQSYLFMQWQVKSHLNDDFKYELQMQKVYKAFLELNNPGTYTVRVRARDATFSHYKPWGPWSAPQHFVCEDEEGARLPVWLTSLLIALGTLLIAMGFVLLFCRFSVMQKLFPPIPHMKDHINGKLQNGRTMTWDPDQDSQEECPVAEVQVLGET
ncbi:interleukin-3 receptor subunit alpha isoform X2 [Eschrichtius robustus]|uniref:interleukin-3 receptor subunit alpha isoform X2 n=1 Tax=Eschrichtius robustus TaxID=9764 RepID=UPI0035C165D3